MASFSTAISSISSDYGADFVLKPKQKEVLRSIWDAPDKDVVVSWPTGFGKSVIAHLSGRVLAARNETTGQRNVSVVIVPLNLIQSDQMDSLRKHNIKACKLDIEGRAEGNYSSDSDSDSDSTGRKVKTNATFESICAGEYEVVLAHPEALLCTSFGDKLLKNSSFCQRVNVLIIDECHTIDMWGASFRRAFSQLDTLVGHFNCPIVALSATVTKDILRMLPTQLGMTDPIEFRESPDCVNMYYERKQKISNMDITESAESVFVGEIYELSEKGALYPVTLMYLPLQWASQAQSLCAELFGTPTLGQDRYGILFSNQDEDVKQYITEQLKLEDPHLRLVMCTSTIGMGFDSPCITRVLHGRPPRTMIDYVQQVGRAGRLGQPSSATLYWNRNDIAKNVPGMSDDIRRLCTEKDCLRRIILKCFGFEKDEQLFPSSCQCCCFCRDSCDCDLHHDV